MAPELRTRRLTLTSLTDGDAPSIQRLAGAYEVASVTGVIPHPYPDGEAERWIASANSLWPARSALTLGMRHQGELIGVVSLIDIRPGHQAELGYWVGVPHWGQGFATEALRTLVDFAFDELALMRIHAHHMARNPASGRVMQKLGMQHEGVLRRHFIKWGQPEDMVLYGLLRSEWVRSTPENDRSAP
ncbi:GNAT family N-acetyltransferase [Chitinibacteraceae bacterium HSL-7]